MIHGGFQLLALLAMVAFWLFVLSMCWKVVECLKGIDASLKEIASRQQIKS